jgi:DNA-directed RNA polymerase subunit RPC12/RpoP
MKKIICGVKGHNYKLVARYLNTNRSVYKCVNCNKIKIKNDTLAEWLEVVCSNCHKRRTAKQFGWYKARINPSDFGV